MMGVCFLVNFMTSSSDPRANILPRSIFGFSAQIRVFRALDQVLTFLVKKLCQIYSKYFRNVLGQPRPTQMAYWAKNYVTVLTRAAH